MMLALPPSLNEQMDRARAPFITSVTYRRRPPRQLAIPARSETTGTVEAGKEELSFADHALRRKTPNGTLSAAYDATPTDKTVQLPATKHILVSSSPEPTNASTAQTPFNFRSRTLNESIRNSTARQVDPRDGVVGRDDIHIIQYAQPVTNPTWDFPGGLDSVLNQNLPLQPSQRYYLQYGSTIPTVLPATLQAHMGPTASASPELYGPYWPDGTFNPYRPAPVRDNRYSGHIPHSNTANLYSQSQYSIHKQQAQIFRGPSQLNGNSHFVDGNTQILDIGSSRPRLPNGSAASSFLVDLDLEGADTRLQHAHASHNADPAQGPFSQNSDWAKESRSEGLVLQPGRESNHLAFRDRTFAWAHRTYVELLASLHQYQKLNPYLRKLHGQPKHMPKPAIFPRPPRRAGSYFSHFSTHHSQAPVQFSTSASPPHYPYQNGGFSGHDISRPPTAIFSPSRRTSNHLNGYLPTNIVSGRLQSFSDHLNDKFGTSQCPPEPMLDQHLTRQQAGSPQANATVALRTLEALCGESRGDWVDGMLLAGCLAYGLGEYLRALGWFQGILASDSTHVEAMSNLAATLLALNRRDEALSHWAAAVELRPSYFEAVEHLIGLLCSSHRSKEAVAIIELVEQSLRLCDRDIRSGWTDSMSEADSDTKSRSSSIATAESLERAQFDYEAEKSSLIEAVNNEPPPPGFGSSGFAIPGAENGRILALLHAKGNMLYSLGDNQGASAAFEDAVLVATGHRRDGIKGLIRNILLACLYEQTNGYGKVLGDDQKKPILLSPEQALQTAKNMFYPSGDLPGLEFVPPGMALKAALSTTSNSLLSLAKIYQDGMSNPAALACLNATPGTRDILALYYLSLSLQPSPSTANNVGILLAGVQQTVHQRNVAGSASSQISNIPGVIPGSGIALALSYYNYGLNLDQNHAHLYTNLGSLLKDINQLNAAIKMYELAVKCDANFDIALANLANAVKDQGRVADAIGYYRRAVNANPDFPEAVCGLATALNSVCGWQGRGGIYADQGKRDRIHVDENGMMFEAQRSSGWIHRVVEIVEKQLRDGETWGVGILSPTEIETLCRQLTAIHNTELGESNLQVRVLRKSIQSWSGKAWEGSRIVRLVERAVRRIGWQWYQDRYKDRKEYPAQRYARPVLPSSFTPPVAPTVLPFHTFTTPLSAKQIRQISQRNGLRISVSTLRSSWLPKTVYPPPAPPSRHLNIGYVSSDFNNHPLAHLMQSVFGLHDPTRVRAFCYATTSSDGSVHREQIRREAPVFYDASSWSVEELVKQIVRDGIHILINLNGYTRGARNEVFAARPAPIQMSFMGFAGTLGAEWCDYIFADSISIPPETLSPWRRNVDIEDRLNPESLVEDVEDWVYSENIIFGKDTFFCCDHRQSSPDATDGLPLNDRGLREKLWEDEQDRRWKLRKEIFPTLSNNAIILGNFNQLYKIDPSTLRMYLRILASVPNAILWLLRFPDLGEQNLLNFARSWAGAAVASRIVFTDVAPKDAHITRASVVDLFLDTPECNAHTTAADVVWSGTPIVTWGKWKYKMCSRMAGSIVASALPLGNEGDEARRDLIVRSEEQYEEHAVRLAGSLKYPTSGAIGRGKGRLVDLRRMLWEGRWTSRLFDTRRWVRDLEKAYWEAWTKWERGEGGDIWL